MQHVIDTAPAWFTPPARAGGGEAVAYLLATPSVLQAARFGRDVTAEGARLVQDDDLRHGLRRFVEETLSPDDPAAVRALAAIEAWAAGGLAEAPEAAEDLAAIEDLALRHDGRYARLVADRQFWSTAAAVVAVRLFVLDWRGHPASPERGSEGLAEASIASIPELHRLQILGEIMRRLRPDAAAEKTSPSPSSPSDGPTNSPAGSTTRRSSRRRRTTAGA